MFIFFFLCQLFPVTLDQTHFKAGGYCDVCKAAVMYISGILENNSTEAVIKEAVRKVCSFLPDSMQTEVRSCLFTLCNSYRPHCDTLALTCVCQQCDQLVEQYEPMLVQLLIQTLDPDFVCMVN